jgi:hypothetical protein
LVVILELLAVGFCKRLSIEFRQIRAVPSAVLVWCRSGNSIHACTSADGRFETTATSFSGIISTSTPHCGHQARSDFRPLRTRSESVSIVILVRFAIGHAFVHLGKRLLGKQESSLPESRGEVLTIAMIISDDFSRSA